MQETHLPGNADFVHLPCYFLITFTRWFFFFLKKSLLVIVWLPCLALGPPGTLEIEERLVLPLVSMQPVPDQHAWRS